MIPALIVLLAIIIIIITAGRGIAKQLKENDSMDQQQLNKNKVERLKQRAKQ